MYDQIHIEGVSRPQLSACPFCGREPDYLAQHINDVSLAEFHAIVCCCGGLAPKAHHSSSSQSKAVTAWNNRVSPWIPVAERLPKENEQVLCAVEFDGPGDWRIKVGGYTPNGNEAHREWKIFGASWTPTHWMPLPATPKDTIT